MITFDYTLLDEISTCFHFERSVGEGLRVVGEDFIKSEHPHMSLHCAFCENPSGVILDISTFGEHLFFTLCYNGNEFGEFTYPYVPTRDDCTNRVGTELDEYTTYNIFCESDNCMEILEICKLCGSRLMSNVNIYDETNDVDLKARVVPRTIPLDNDNDNI